MRRWSGVYPGTPQPQLRARHGLGRTYTPSKTRSAQMALKVWLSHYGPAQSLSGPLRVVLRFTFVPPKSWPAYRQALAAERNLPHTSRPDLDNLAKLVKDAANGVLWVDDSQVAELKAVKVYAPIAQTVIGIEELEAVPQSKAEAEQMRRRIEDERASQAMAETSVGWLGVAGEP